MAGGSSQPGVINGAAGVINEGERSGAGPGAAGCSDGRRGTAGLDTRLFGGSTFRRAGGQRLASREEGGVARKSVWHGVWVRSIKLYLGESAVGAQTQGKPFLRFCISVLCG